MPSVLLLLLAITAPPPVHRQTTIHLTMGFRVGEVTQDEALVWTRLCARADRNPGGISETGPAGPREDVFVAPAVALAEREGEIPGIEGEARIVYSRNPDLSAARTTAWRRVSAASDYAAVFTLAGLQPERRYYLRAEGRTAAGFSTTTSENGSFLTPQAAEQWQEVRFTVITGQAYRDLDDPNGYKIYSSMLEVAPHFIVPTGDTVYYDNEVPRARTMDLARYHWHRMYSLPGLINFHRWVPGYWLKDDHDILADDTWPGQDPEWMRPMTFVQGQRIFEEQVPAAYPPYRTVRWGKGLQIWLVEGRDFRSPNSLPDGPEKTIWGREQLEWLKRTLLESDAAFKVLISPTPIVGPDRPSKADNHCNAAFSFEGSHFRNWTKEAGLEHFYVACGDRHWQYFSVDPESGLREFSCGPASDEHAGGSPGEDPTYHRFHRVAGGFLSVEVSREKSAERIIFRHHDVDGEVVYEYEDR